MVAKNFALALSYVLRSEGAYSNNRFDPGHATMRGVTQSVYTRWRQLHGQSVQSVRLISDVELNEIYRAQYWQAVHGDELPEGLDYAVFDAAVNSGPTQAIKWLQRALGISADGHYGIATAGAVAQIKNVPNAIDAFDRARLGFLRHLRTWPVFGKGWFSRVNLVTDRAKKLAA